MNAILMTKEVWMNSILSVARFFGEVRVNGTRYILMTNNAIRFIDMERDLVDNEFVKYYRKLGRDRFIQVLEQNRHAGNTSVAQAMKNALSEFKLIKRTVKTTKQ